MDIDILYSDSEIIVVDKPGGLLSVPGRGPDKQDCVVTRAQATFSDIIKQPAVHRLDMYTSGVMVLARTSESHKNISKQFEQRKTIKKYIALLDGILKEDSGRIELKFRLDVNNRPHQIYDPVQGKTSITLWRKITVESNSTRVEFSPLTGRTHQLRLHAAHESGLNMPIIGDKLYGSGKEGDQMMLHASSLTIFHPATQDTITFVSKVPF
jgi:tRNA pseudouridine32 synthase/23S rRNA pseudouridine746 synthase